MPIKHKNILNVWLALTLSVLFFYPLLATLNDNIIILQWRTQNSQELIAAVIVFTAFLTAALWSIDKIVNEKLRLVLILLIFTIPFISFFVHFLQQLNFKDVLITVGQYTQKNHFLVAPIGVLCVVAFLVFTLRYTREMTFAIILILFSLSPLNVLAFLTLWNVRHTNTNIEINNTSVIDEKKIPHQKHNLIVLLFDELSYEYLYKGASINPRYSNFHRLSLISDNYHLALSPGKQTLTAIPGMFMGRRYDNILMKYNQIYRITKDDKEEYLKIEPDNLFDVAKDKGYRTFLSGSYLPYCEMFSSFLDGCRSFSIYNYASVKTQFSLLNPIMTNLIIWPHQMPQGYFKNWAVSLWQKKQTEQSFKLMLATIDEKTPTFMFSHIFSTHVPFVFNHNGYYANKEPFVQNSENYSKALEYADYLLGELINKMKKKGTFETSEIIVLSDHNYRIMFPENEYHIPLIAKKPYQRTKQDFFELVYVESILKDIVRNLPHI